ncbi:Rne/Rng family ribonuclease [Corynebacterium pseudotuberculosis 258]|uniref:Ribonuclease E n=1 Tax=Corynebacterium pseudotuberculosis 258 TaxID=1168865 RepID=A0AAU8PYF9_CORPS|nr:translation initiation factor IF-2 N-terminal domain-containing protein [Corynebacterium pseudotuberculosis]AEQ07117.2 Rne/Rng family ribonuclease [Corynebacterium pseudotuberculosis CIP 52.97]AFK17215.1 Rne/Rng family ribonuclease [Corynebacterium pseudotuberculosis 258]
MAEETTKKVPARRATRKAATRKAAEDTATQDTVVPVDRDAIGDRIRVHALAKLASVSSRELIATLATLGLTKVAQSTLTREEALKLLDAHHIDSYSAEEKLRHRVEKNVENEIHQIEEKVERELNPDAEAAKLDDPEEPEKLRRRIEKNVENEIHQIEEKVERELQDREVVREEDHQDSSENAVAEDTTVVITEDEAAELLSDIEPEITPAPGLSAPAFPTPLFIAPTPAEELESNVDDSVEDDEESAQSRRRRRGRRGTGRGKRTDSEDSFSEDLEESPDSEDAGEEKTEELITEPVGIKGSTRLEAQRRRRAEMREESRNKRHIVSEAEFLARRGSVKRTMIVRERERSDHPGVVTQVGVLEDDLLVEHFVTSDTQSSMIGNIYLGRVQNVLPSMEAAFIDIGKGRNGVLYAGEVDWRAAGLGGRGRRIEQALKSGDQVLVQVSKDPAGHKGARLTTQISFAGRYLVYVPNGRTAGISRKLPAPERKRLKNILKEVVPKDGGAIIRTAAENVSAEAIAADVNRLHKLWNQIQELTEKEKNSKGAKPVTMYEEPNMLVKVVRDLFNEDFSELIVDGDRAWNTVHAYIQSVAPELQDRLIKFDREAHEDRDAFEVHRVDEQLHKALSRKVWLPSGGTLVIDRTEAMTVIDVNTGKFTGSGGNLEETVTRNNLEAAEEIVRQMRLRDLGGMIVVDFIDMVLSENQDLVLRRLTEALGRDRTRHQISEVTSLGLVQMTRKRLGTGLLETFATECEHCEGRGVIIHDDPVEQSVSDAAIEKSSRARSGKAKAARKHGVAHQDPAQHPAAIAMQHHEEAGSAAGSNTSDASTADTSPVADTRTSIDDLAAAVVIDDVELEKVVDSVASDVAEPGLLEPSKEKKGRRRRRGLRNSKRKDRGAADDVMDIVDAALDRAFTEDPDEPSGADHLPLSGNKLSRSTTSVTYEEALAAFENSPRRKRAVRGNSVSDHAPKPEDFKRIDVTEGAEEDTFASEASEETYSGSRRSRRVARKQGETRKAVENPTQSEAADDTESTGNVKIDSLRGRRRRAVRRRFQETNLAPLVVETAEEESTAKGRRRRRAVRKTVVKAPRKAVIGEESSGVYVKDETVPETREASSAGRGRRRVARRVRTATKRN